MRPGKAIDILTEADASEKRQKEFIERSGMFEKELDVDETLAQLLVAEGFGELEEVAYVEIEELASIEGFDEDLAQELQSRAQEAIERREQAAREERTALGVEDALAELPYLTEAMLVTLGKAGGTGRSGSARAPADARAGGGNPPAARPGCSPAEGSSST